jgi:hypothetical protein
MANFVVLCNIVLTLFFIAVVVHPVYAQENDVVAVPLQSASNNQGFISSDNAPGVLGDYITIISFLVATASFVLGIKLSQTLLKEDTARSYNIIILALLIPSGVLVAVGIGIILAFSLYSTELLQFLILIIPIIGLLIVNRR